MAKVKLNEFLTLESSDGGVTVDTEGLERMIRALDSAAEESRKQSEELAERAEAAARQATDLRTLLRTEHDKNAALLRGKKAS